MFWDEITPEKEDELINKTAEIILKYDMDVPAILFLGTFKPLVSLGGQLGRYFLGPLLPFITEREDAFIQTFEKRENIEKLIKILEESRKEEEARKKAEKASEEEVGKSGWRRFLPF